jgi:hypothetical protein
MKFRYILKTVRENLRSEIPRIISFILEGEEVEGIYTNL